MAADVSLKMVLEKLNDIDLTLQALADDTSNIKRTLAELDAKVGSSHNQCTADKSADGQRSRHDDDHHHDRRSSWSNCAARRCPQRSSGPPVQHKQRRSPGSRASDVRTGAQGHWTLFTEQASTTSFPTQPASVSSGGFSLDGHETRRRRDTAENHANPLNYFDSGASGQQGTASSESRKEDIAVDDFRSGHGSGNYDSRQQDIAVGNGGLSPVLPACDQHDETTDHRQNIQVSLCSVSPGTTNLHEYSQDDAPSRMVLEYQDSSSPSHTPRNCVTENTIAITPSSTVMETGDIPPNKKNHRDRRRRSRYSLRPRRTRGDSAKMDIPERLPPLYPEASFPKKTRTSRGLANRTSTENTSESVQGTGSTQLVEAATEEDHVGVTAVAPATSPDNDVVNGVPSDHFTLEGFDSEDFCIDLTLFDEEELQIQSHSSLQKADNESLRASSVLAVPSEPVALFYNQELFRRMSTGSSDNASATGALTTAPVWPLSELSLPDALNLVSCQEPDPEKLSQAQRVPEDLAQALVFGVEGKDFDTVERLPTVDVFRGLLAVVRESVTTDQVRRTLAVLKGWVNKFPPVTPALSQLYETALDLGDWKIFRAMLKSAVECGSTTPTFADSRPGIILRLVMAVLERNFLYYLHHACAKADCLVMRLLWAPSYIIVPNNRTEDLLDCLEAALRASTTTQAYYEELLSLVSMAAQCLRWQETGSSFRSTRNGQPKRSSQIYVQKLARLLQDYSLDILDAVSPPWLLREVCATLLQDRCSDCLVPGGVTSDPWTLTTVVSKYGFLLPRPSHEMESENSCFRPPSSTFTLEKIREKDHKGETRLHKAARKNDVTSLKDLLRVEGVDVNVQDYAGWTPLQEACNHGSIDAVKVLLHLVPFTEANTHFHSGTSSKTRRVDLYIASNEKGFTALHDAVWRNHVDIAKLLLRYGGSRLLEAETSKGYKAMDLAETAEMKQVLTGQNFDSQEPWPSMYADVLVCDNGHKLTVNYQEASTFLRLLTLLTRAHLQQTKDDAGSALEPDDAVVQCYCQRFRRHIERITSKEVYQQLFKLLDIFEYLLRSAQQQ